MKDSCKIEFEEISYFNGIDLIDLKYEPLFPFFKDHKNSFKILGADFVSEIDGTGIVHMAPDFGEDDYRLCKENGINVLTPIDDAGCFTINETIDYKIGNDIKTLVLDKIQVFETNDEIIKYLKAKENWIATEQYIHNYPHCWRTDTPLIYRAISSWYLLVNPIKDRMIELNKQINWIPEHIKDGQFGKWLENARDWCISRNRFWGCPIPVWKSENPENKELYVFGSIKEMEDFFECKIDSLHKPEIDKLIKNDPYNSSYKIKRVDDVLDCWFESGSMPFASIHYPFENQEYFEKNFPADFIVEYLAQTRGWFYTLVVLGVSLFDKIPFKNCLCHGVVLDVNGEKLSKRLRNYPDPLLIFDKLGSDSMRWAMLRNTITKGEDLRIDKDGKVFEESINKIINPIQNAFNFLITYAEIDKIKFKEFDLDIYFKNDCNLNKKSNIFDKFIINEFKKFASEFVDYMNNYDTVNACSISENFIEILNNWYIRRNKKRFWSSEHDKDKTDAYATLSEVLFAFLTLTAPLLPFTSEKLYQNYLELCQ